MKLKRDSHEHSDHFFRADIRPEKSSCNQGNFFSTEKSSIGKVSNLAFFCTDKAYPGYMDFIQALYKL